jgi:hypothetical protein
MYDSTPNTFQIPFCFLTVQVKKDLLWFCYAKQLSFYYPIYFFLRKISAFYKYAKASSPASRFPCPVFTSRKFPVFFAPVKRPKFGNGP